MKTNILIAILFSAFTTSCISQKALPANHINEEAAITAAIKTLETGWNTKSGEMFASRFSDNHDYIIWDGTFIPDMPKAMNVQAHQGLFDGVYRNSEIFLEVAKIKFFRKDLAQASVNCWNYQKGAERPNDPLLLMTMILDKNKGDWEIVSFHNSDIHVGRMSDRNAQQWYADQEVLIKTAAHNIVEGWNNRDAKAMGDLMTENCAFSVSNEGYQAKTTNKEVESGHAWLFENVLKEKGQVKVTNTDVQFLDGELALVHMQLEEPSKEDLTTNEKNMAQLILERNRYGTWLIKSFYLAPMNLKESQ